MNPSPMARSVSSNPAYFTFRANRKLTRKMVKKMAMQTDGTPRPTAGIKEAMNAIQSTELNEAIRRGPDAVNTLLRSNREALRCSLNSWLSGQSVPKQDIDNLHADIAGCQAALRNS